VLLAAVAFVGIASAVGAVGGSSGIRAPHETSVVAFPAVERPHGPYFESAADLDGASPVPRSAAHPARDEDAYRMPSTSSALSPAPTAGPFEVAGGGNDPQIAASETHIVVTTNGEIGFYAKSGRLLTTDHLGNAMRNPIRPFDFFHHMWNGRRNRTNIDFGLKLPLGLHCDVTKTTPKGDLPDA
jgi:hypothetical protein